MKFSCHKLKKKISKLKPYITAKLLTNVTSIRLRLNYRNFIWSLHARYPEIVSNPYGDWKDDFNKYDTENNAQTTIDPDISLKLGYVTISEIFGPSEIDDLFKGLEGLGWDRDRFSINREKNTEWIKKQRLYGSEGRMPLGFVVRESDKKKYPGIRYSAEFPQEFSALLVNIAQLTPSITCLSITFVLTEMASSEYTTAINTPAMTKRVPQRRNRAYSIKNVEIVKGERVSTIRGRYRRIAIDWMTKKFSGYFFKNCQVINFPTVEYLSLAGYTPFDDETIQSQHWRHWSRFVNLDTNYASWTCSYLPSLRLSTDTISRESLPNHITVALRTDGLKDSELDGSGIESLESQAYFVNERINDIVSNFALVTYLHELLRGLKETKQLVSNQSRTRRSSQEIKQISDFFRDSIGVPAIARETIALSGKEASFSWDATGFIQKNRRDEDRPHDINNMFKSLLGRLSRQLLEEDKDTRDFLNQLSSAIGTRESIAAQRRMEWIAAIALIVAIISLTVAVFSEAGTGV